jgi:SSU ribosomal protein S7P
MEGEEMVKEAKIKDISSNVLDDLLLFDKWRLDEIVINDPSIKNYVSLKPVIVPHTCGRHKGKDKSKENIVERLINKVMRTEKNTGKKLRAYNIVKKSFEIINERTGQNPMQVLINAIGNAGPREETVHLKYAGLAVPKSVDTSPQRRVDEALMFITKGTSSSSFKNKKPVEECLASEIIAAANYDIKCYSISKKEEKERVAKAAR